MQVSIPQTVRFTSDSSSWCLGSLILHYCPNTVIYPLHPNRCLHIRSRLSKTIALVPCHEAALRDGPLILTLKSILVCIWWVCARHGAHVGIRGQPQALSVGSQISPCLRQGLSLSAEMPGLLTHELLYTLLSLPPCSGRECWDRHLCLWVYVSSEGLK